ncbi:hypothetical protein HDV00_000666 [Rhizophlyctis rosea]|nr:hypothetical protein HDV00_000666 [Rhizophlyctis rosea]
MATITITPLNTPFLSTSHTSVDDFLDAPPTPASICDFYPNVPLPLHFGDDPFATSIGFANGQPLLHPLDIHYPSCSHAHLHGGGDLKLEDLFPLIEDNPVTSQTAVDCSALTAINIGNGPAGVTWDHGLPSPARSIHDGLESMDFGELRLGCDSGFDGISAENGRMTSGSEDGSGLADVLCPSENFAAAPETIPVFDGDLSSFTGGMTHGDTVSALFGHEMVPSSPIVTHQVSSSPIAPPTVLVKLEDHVKPYSPPVSPILPLDTPPLWPLSTTFPKSERGMMRHSGLPSPSESMSSSSSYFDDPLCNTGNTHRRTLSNASTTSTTSLPPIIPTPTPVRINLRTKSAHVARAPRKAKSVATAKTPKPPVKAPTQQRTSYPAIYKCEFPGCAKVFTRSYNLKSHRKIHTGDELFLCPYCPSRFTRGHDLKRHVRLHTNERPFRCPNCDRSFSRSDALKRHVKVDACHGREAEPEPEAEHGEEDEQQQQDVTEDMTEDERETEADVEAVKEQEDEEGVWSGDSE